MPTQQESQQELLRARATKLPDGLADDIGQRARESAVITFDKNIEKGLTPTQASNAARKEFEGVLRPWDLLL